MGDYGSTAEHLCGLAIDLKVDVIPDSGALVDVRRRRVKLPGRSNDERATTNTIGVESIDHISDDQSLTLEPRTTGGIEDEDGLRRRLDLRGRRYS